MGFNEDRMFKVTLVLVKMGIFQRGSLLLGNARHGYTSRLGDFSSRANWWIKNVWPCADRDRQESVACVWSGAELSLNIMQIKIKVVDRDG